MLHHRRVCNCCTEYLVEPYIMGRAPFTIAEQFRAWANCNQSMIHQTWDAVINTPLSNIKLNLDIKFNLKNHVLETLGCVKPWSILSNSQHCTTSLHAQREWIVDETCSLHWQGLCSMNDTWMLSIFAMTVVGAACNTAGVIVFMSGTHWFQLDFCSTMLSNVCVGWRLHNCVEVVAPLISFMYVLGFTTEAVSTYYTRRTCVIDTFQRVPIYYAHAPCAQLAGHPHQARRFSCQYMH